MKKVILLLSCSMLALSAAGQRSSRPSAQPPASAAAPVHLPKAITEANLKQWVRDYPKEAAAYTATLEQQLQAINPSTDGGKYDEVKGRYAQVSRLMAEQAAGQGATR